ncbi:MAG: hypothetical protein NT150_02055 [Bacteroidetes bacterium]|nr:hypothetical protein [Bacteroidota bacterium]
MKRLVFLVFPAVLLTSCLKDEYDFAHLNTKTLNPGVAAPLINTDLVLGDLIESVDTNLIGPDQDNLLHLTYSSNLFSYKVADLITIPSQSITQAFGLSAFTIPAINTSASVTLGTVVAGMSNPQKSTLQSANGSSAPFPAIPAQSGGSVAVPTLSGFASVTFSSGTLSMDITNNWPTSLSNLNIEIRNVSGNGLVATFNYPSIAAGASASASASLIGVTMKSDIKVMITSFSSPGTFPIAVPIDLSDDLSMDISTANLGVASASAVFPSQEVLNQSIESNLSMPNGAELNTIILKAGAISYDIDYGIRENAQLLLTLPYVKKNGVAFSQVINLNSNHITATNATGSFDLAGYTFDLTGGGSKVNYLPANIVASVVSSGSAVPINSTDSVKATITIDQLAFSYIEGYLGTQALNIPSDSLDFSFFKNPLGANISLADPKLTLKLKSSVGIPINGDLSALSVIGENGNNLAFTGIANPLVINSPIVVGNTAITNIVIDKNTTNIIDVLSSNPKSIIYGMTGTLNPNGKTTNFITDSSAISVAMDMDVPLYGSVSGFVIKDTIAFPVQAFENVLTATLRTNITSEYPIEAEVQMYFLDETYQLVDSLFTNGYEVVVPSSTVDVNGELVSASTKQTDLKIDEAKVEALKNVKYVVLASKLATANGGATAAKFYSTYKMNVKLGVLAQVKIDIKQK